MSVLAVGGIEDKEPIENDGIKPGLSIQWTLTFFKDEQQQQKRPRNEPLNI